MIDWRSRFGKEARALAFFVPLIVISALFGSEAMKSQATDRLSESPVSPVSPVASQSLSNDTVSLGLQNNVWLIAVVLVIVVAAAIIWFVRRPRGA